MFSPKRLVSFVAGLPLKTGWNYSNTNYVLAQMIIERVTHDSYADQLRRRIVIPLGLHNLFFSAGRYPRTVTAREPAGYFYVGPDALPAMASQFGKDQSRYPVTGPASGGIVSSLADLVKWDRALFTGRELPRKQQRELESLVSTKTAKPIKNTTRADPVGFGLGVAQMTDPGLGTVWAYEGFFNVGFSVASHLCPTLRQRYRHRREQQAGSRPPGPAREVGLRDVAQGRRELERSQQPLARAGRLAPLRNDRDGHAGSEASCCSDRPGGLILAIPCRPSGGGEDRCAPAA